MRQLHRRLYQLSATSAALGLAPGKLLAGEMAADNIAMALYLAIISSWPVPALQRDANSLPGSGRSSPPAAVGGPAATSELVASDQPLSDQGSLFAALHSAALALPAAAAACWAGDMLTAAIGLQGGGLALMAVAATAIAAAASAVASRWQAGGIRHSSLPFAGEQLASLTC